MVNTYLVLFIFVFFPTTPPFRHPSFLKEGNFIGLVIYSILLLREGGVPLVGEVVGVILSFMFSRTHHAASLHYLPLWFSRTRHAVSLLVSVIF